MNKILFKVTLCLLLFAQFVFAENDDLYRFKPAYPEELHDFQSDVRIPRIWGNKHVAILVNIDDKGKALKVVPKDISDSLFVRYVEAYVLSIPFIPAKLESKSVESLLPINIVFMRKIKTPDFTFPHYEKQLVDNSQLISDSYKLNGVNPPEIISFPSYFCDVKTTDSSVEYPYLISKVSLDKEGRPTAVSNIKSTIPTFSGQIESAILYGEYAPLTVNGKKHNSEILLMVSFFPLINYPTSDFITQGNDSLPKLEKYRVRIIPQLNSLLCEPLPKRIRDHLMTKNVLDYYLLEPIEAFIRIDTLGKVRIIRVESDKKQIISTFRNIVKKLRFYPAVNKNYNKEEYYGYIRIEPFDKMKIRISYLWLK